MQPGPSNLNPRSLAIVFWMYPALSLMLGCVVSLGVRDPSLPATATTQGIVLLAYASWILGFVWSTRVSTALLRAQMDRSQFRRFMTEVLCTLAIWELPALLLFVDASRRHTWGYYPVGAGVSVALMVLRLWPKIQAASRL